MRNLIEEVRQFWRFWSVRLAIVAGVIAGAIVEQPEILTGLIAYVPMALRPAASAVIGAAVFLLPTLLHRHERKTGGAA
ncbi:hypothetical protein BRX37_16575 [Sphingomonas sp. S-NIH.Pt3_0716]|nr:hypothetical protein BRX37_16575 [Sphingomonas sp. S-NIH.Pt3_0716]